MQPLLKLAIGAGLAAIPLISNTLMAEECVKVPGYVTDCRGVIVRTDFNPLGIRECWHTSEWTPDMAVVGCDGKVAEVAVEPPPPYVPDEVAPTPCEDHLTVADEGGALFAFNKARLSVKSMSKLDEFISRIKTKFQQVDHIVVVGHTDRLGSNAYNMRLSKRRAEAVRDYLLDQQAVEPGRIEVDARGESEPLPDVYCDGIKAKKRLIACLAPNRRVVVDVNGTGECK